MRSSFLRVLMLGLLAAPIYSQWIKQNVDTKASFRGLSVVNDKVVWASGTGGTVIRTIDGGKTWKVMTVPGAEKLDFRDIEAFDANTAYILSIGNGESSRIYKTTDGGINWNLQFKNTNPKAFFDAMACWDRNNCIAMSDPVDGKFPLISTKDGGANWRPMDTSKMPPAKEGEAAFAASGTCLITQGRSNAFLVTGGSAARVFRSTDRGRSWTVAETPIVHGTSGSGIFSIAMFDDKHGVLVGGNYEKPTDRNNTFAITNDGGEHWFLGARVHGYRSSAIYLDRRTLITVGTTGSDVSYDRRLLWHELANENLNSVATNGKSSVWAVGQNGAVNHIDGLSIATNRETFEPKSTDYPHLANVTWLSLSHSEISSSCTRKNTECSDDLKITVQTTTYDFNSPHEILYYVSAGQVVGEGPVVQWDLSGVKPGKYSITAAVSTPASIYDANTYWDVYGKTETKFVVVH